MRHYYGHFYCGHSVVLELLWEYIDCGHIDPMKPILCFDSFLCSAIPSPTKVAFTTGRVIIVSITNSLNPTPIHTMPNEAFSLHIWVGYWSRSILM
mmetsp:Transcript_8948/g.25688  ORF Transcript_8948/g.25688 Transcript_8948/m.25688 type:complete len:96 (-) Transcript_8948:633-920(-)